MQPINIIDYEDDVNEVHFIPVMSGGGENPVVIISARMGSMNPVAVRLHARWAYKHYSHILTNTGSRARGVSVITPEN